MTMPRLRLAVAIGAGPTFYAGSTHTAHLGMENPTDRDWDYIFDLYIGTERVGQVVKSLTAGERVVEDLEVTMPLVAGVYDFYALAWCTTPDWERELDPTPFEAITIVEMPAPAVNLTLTWD